MFDAHFYVADCAEVGRSHRGMVDPKLFTEVKRVRSWNFPDVIAMTGAFDEFTSN